MSTMIRLSDVVRTVDTAALRHRLTGIAGDRDSAFLQSLPRTMAVLDAEEQAITEEIARRDAFTGPEKPGTARNGLDSTARDRTA